MFQLVHIFKIIIWHIFKIILVTFEKNNLYLRFLKNSSFKRVFLEKVLIKYSNFKLVYVKNLDEKLKYKLTTNVRVDLKKVFECPFD